MIKLKVLVPMCVLGLSFMFFSAQSAQAADYTPKAGDLIKTKTNPTVFLVDDQLTRWPVSAQAYAIRYHNNFTLIKIVADSQIGSFDPTGGLNSTSAEPEGTLVMYTTNNPTVYLLQNGFKRPFATFDAFTKAGHSMNQVKWIGTYDVYPTGSVIE